MGVESRGRPKESLEAIGHSIRVSRKSQMARARCLSDARYVQLETAELKVQLLKNQEALSEAEMGSVKEAEAAEELMQQTSARLDNVQKAYAHAQEKAQKLARHSQNLQYELREKAAALSSAQAAQDLSLSRVRSLEAERLYLKKLIGDSSKEATAAGNLVHALEAAQQERKLEQAEASRVCAELQDKVSALEAQLLDKDRLLESMQIQLHESALSHNSIAGPSLYSITCASVNRPVYTGDIT